MHKKKKHTIMKIIGIIFSVIIASSAILLIHNGKEQKRQQALMVKSDDELIGTHFYMPRNHEESVDMNLYLLNDGSRHPLVVNLHGGAFIAGDADTLDTQSSRISKEWNVHVAAINYKLANGKYDIAYGTQEVVDTIIYFRTHADEYNVDPDQIFVLGYSAGGYHAMASVLALKKQKIDVAGQIICYGFIKEVNNTYLSLNEEQRRTIAPALFILADNDPISDGSLTYEQSLAANGAAVEVKRIEGSKHGFIEENNPEYDVLKTTSRSSEQEKMAREAEKQIGQWILQICKSKQAE